MSSVFKGHAAVPQPGDCLTSSVEGRFTQDRVVGAAVEVNDQTSRFDLDAAAGFDELAVEVLRLGLGKAMQLLCQPAVTAISDNGHVEVHIEPDFARQAIEMKEVDADAQAVFDAVAAGVAQDHIASGDVAVIGEKE